MHTKTVGGSLFAAVVVSVVVFAVAAIAIDLEHSRRWQSAGGGGGEGRDVMLCLESFRLLFASIGLIKTVNQNITARNGTVSAQKVELCDFRNLIN